MAPKPAIAVHKFSSCDGCQLAFLNLGEDLLRLCGLVDIVHFAEAGPVDPAARVEIAFVEGSVTTAEEIERIHAIRENSVFLVTLGACATAGGLQALRNGVENFPGWVASVYASPEHIRSLAESSPIKKHVKVDFELWGCPVNTGQVLAAVRDLLSGVRPALPADSVCQECKRNGNVCVLVAKGEPCLGPVTRTGCGALCPSFGRDCYACFGPAEQANPASLSRCFEGLGLLPEHIARRFLFINNATDKFSEAGRAALAKGDRAAGESAPEPS